MIDRFSLNIVLRVIVLLTLCLIFGILFFRSEFFFSQIIIGAIIVIITVDLIRFSRRSNRELSKFLLAIKHGDVSVNFTGDQLGKDFKHLAESFRFVIQSLQKIKIEKEAQFHLLQTIIDQIRFGIIAYTEDGEILLMNQPAAIYLKTALTKDWNYVKKSNPEFVNQIGMMVTDGRKLIEIDDKGEIQQFSVHKTSLIMMGKGCQMITFYDIQTEIEQKEIEAWYKLIRILAHEIMNSVTPLTSLTDTILMLLERTDGSQKEVESLSEQNIEDIISSVKTIKNRTHGILKFVEAYRKLTDIPHPEREMILLEDLFMSVSSLLASDLKKREIDMSIVCKPNNLKLNCDMGMMEQVLINLVTNGMYALENRKNPLLKLSGTEVDSKIIINVEDNGKGIDADKMNKIFIPFYSTRDEGSGIGLSFSKFVIHQHDGRIKVESIKDEGSRFLVILPKS